eukprot:PhF_6_TR35734/c0_g1_i2/m.51890/K00019/E1.1.1.30, bdh; 3-hydroxybutyrate dehydrogenase
MKARGFGRILNVASVHGLVASQHKAPYVASKHGVVGFTKAVALDLAQTPITCNAICPGFVLTPLIQAQLDAVGGDAVKLLGPKQPSGKFVTLDQLSALALFLCGEGGSEVRGVAWNMDGGWVAQ